MTYSTKIDRIPPYFGSTKVLSKVRCTFVQRCTVQYIVLFLVEKYMTYEGTILGREEYWHILGREVLWHTILGREVFIWHTILGREVLWHTKIDRIPPYFGSTKVRCTTLYSTVHVRVALHNAFVTTYSISGDNKFILYSTCTCKLFYHISGNTRISCLFPYCTCTCSLAS